MKELIKNILIEIGENPDREGLKKTPIRVEKALHFLTKGYKENIEDIVNGALYQSENNEMIILKDIEFYSLCEHHLLPFYGKCHIAYIPDKTIIGLSKLSRITELYSRRLQIQERLTSEIAECLENVLHPLGVGVVIEAVHLCMMMRGVQKQSSNAVTSALRGKFKSDSRTRNEFLNLIRKNNLL